MNWTGTKTLVTGAGGFIGSHVCEELVRRGSDVTAFVRYTSRGDPGLLRLLDPSVRRSLRIVAGDLRDQEAVRAAMRGQQVVLHLGALIAIPYSYVHPTEVAQVNILGTLNVLNAARDLGVTRVVHTSTSEVYGTARFVPISEEHPFQPQSPYSASKIGADALALSYHMAFGLPVSILRPFNTYGPRQSGRAVIPTIIGQVLYADKIQLGSLNPTRDFTFVTDTVAGFLAVAENDKSVGQALNIGHGQEISVGDLAKRIMARIGKQMPIIAADERLRPERSEVFRLCSDAAKARQILGWQPRVSLDKGLDKVIAFMRDHPDWTKVDRYEV